MATTTELQYHGTQRRLAGARVTHRRYLGAGRYAITVEHHGRDYAMTNVRSESIVRREIAVDPRTPEQIAGDLLQTLHAI